MKSGIFLLSETQTESWKYRGIFYGEYLQRNDHYNTNSFVFKIPESVFVARCFTVRITAIPYINQRKRCSIPHDQCYQVTHTRQCRLHLSAVLFIAEFIASLFLLPGPTCAQIRITVHMRCFNPHIKAKGLIAQCSERPQNLAAVYFLLLMKCGHEAPFIFRRPTVASSALKEA